MIQAVGLLLCGVLAVGLWRIDDFVLLLACWIIGLVLHAGLAASGRSRQAAVAAREAFLAESTGACLLGFFGLTVVLAADTTRLDLLAQRLPLIAASGGMLDWAGGAVLLAVVCRLGLPPLPWWPARATAAPPAVRVFLLAGVHPATAILLWYRLAAWLQPWHHALALWFGAAAALLLIMAAAGERHGPRRAAWLGASQWAGLLAAGSDPLLCRHVVLLAVGLGLVHMQAVLVRWPVALQRSLLCAGGVVILWAGLVSGLARLDTVPAFLRLAAASMTAWVLICWWFEAARVDVVSVTRAWRRPAATSLAGLARLGRSAGPIPTMVAMTVRFLGRVVSDFDRIVLAGIVQNAGWLVLGTGRLVAWMDRRGQDILHAGAVRLLELAGSATVRAAAGSPQRLLLVALIVILGLAWIGWAAR